MDSEYLGDGVYAEWDGYHFILYTFDGYQRRDVIYLDDSVVLAFINYLIRHGSFELSLGKQGAQTEDK